MKMRSLNAKEKEYISTEIRRNIWAIAYAKSLLEQEESIYYDKSYIQDRLYNLEDDNRKLKQYLEK